MVFEHIEKLKREYTDKYVVVENGRPELRRFQGLTGTVKTVNMSGRALVEFDAFNNIGWYDIDVDFLKVIDQPLAQKAAATAEEPAAKKPVKAKPAAEPASKAAPAAKDMSVADILAAARSGEKSAAKPKASAPTKDPKKMSVEEMLAAARANKGAGKGDSPAPAADAGEKKKQELTATLEAARRPAAGSESAPAAEAPKPAQKADPKKMTVEEMLAAARAETSSGKQPAAETEVQEEVAAAATPEAAEATPVAEATPGAEETTAPSDTKPPAQSGPLPTETADIIAYCRRTDGT